MIISSLTLDETNTLLGDSWNRFLTLKRFDKDHHWKENPEIKILEKEIRKLRVQSNKNDKELRRKKAESNRKEKELRRKNE